MPYSRFTFQIRPTCRLLARTFALIQYALIAVIVIRNGYLSLKLTWTELILENRFSTIIKSI